MTRSRILQLVAVLGLCAWPSAWGATTPVLEAQAIGTEGELYRVWSGNYGDLFDDAQHPADSPALAVDVVSQSGSETRRLIPGTGGYQLESHPAVTYDDVSSSLYLVWQSRQPAGGDTTLYFVDFRDGGGLSLPLALLSGQEEFGSRPLLEASRSTFSMRDAEGVAQPIRRTVLHLSWTESSQDGLERSFYLPIVVFGESAVGAGPAVDLSNMTPPGVGPAPAAIPAALAREPDLDQGSDSQSYVLTYADRATGLLMTVRLRAIPGEIGVVADKARHVIIGWGLKIGVVATGATSGELIEREILEAAAGLHPAAAEYLGRRSREIVDEFGLGPESVDKARHVIIGWGAEAGGSGVLDQPLYSEMLEIAVDPGFLGQPLSNFIEIAVLAQRPLPEGIGVGAQAISSPTGSAAVVLWRETGAIAFRISDGLDDWGPVHRHIAITPEEEEQIISSLRERVRRR